MSVSPTSKTLSGQGPADTDRSAMRDYYQARVEGTNINSTTLLTTDYLNHFSSIMMLLEMLPSAPEDFAQEVLSWEPRSYTEHFESSGFRDKELAISAYQYVSDDIRLAFEKNIRELNALICTILEGVKIHMDAGDLPGIATLVSVGNPELNLLIEQAASIVNGEIDAADTVAKDVDVREEESAEAHQAAIDALFD